VINFYAAGKTMKGYMDLNFHKANFDLNNHLKYFGSNSVPLETVFI